MPKKIKVRKPKPSNCVRLSLEEYLRMLADSQVELDPKSFSVVREGVYGHSFKCMECGVHFNVYSWQASRHRVDNTYCPECGKQGGFLHYRTTLSESPTFNMFSDKEIFNFCPIRGSEMMDDSKGCEDMKTVVIPNGQ
ncbi:MAG: hypothetical protein ACYC69_02585 [Thermodesulfovibrionales bacterium]